MGASLKSQGRASGKMGRRMMAHKPVAEINVTPFVDVMLVLLIIFMVAAPLLTTAVPVDLPKADAQTVQEEDDKPIEISMTKDGRIFLGETEVEPERLVYLLQAMTDNKKDKRIFVRGDSELSYGIIMALMGRINKAGFNKVALVTDSKH